MDKVIIRTADKIQEFKASEVWGVNFVFDGQDFRVEMKEGCLHISSVDIHTLGMVIEPRAANSISIRGTR